MSTKTIGEYSYKIIMQCFQKQPCLEYARQAFLICRKYEIPVPAEVLDIIVERFKIKEIVQRDYDKWKKVQLKHIVAHSEKRWPKEKILSCALRTETFVDACKLYNKEEAARMRKDPAHQVVFVDDNSLWQRLNRFLDDELPDLIKDQFISYPYSPKEVIKKELKDKLVIYRELMGLIC